MLYTVICSRQCSSLWRRANKSAKQQQNHKIPQVALFIYLHLPGRPAAKRRWHTLPWKSTVWKMQSALNWLETRKGVGGRVCVGGGCSLGLMVGKGVLVTRSH